VRSADTKEQRRWIAPFRGTSLAKGSTGAEGPTLGKSIGPWRSPQHAGPRGENRGAAFSGTAGPADEPSTVSCLAENHCPCPAGRGNQAASAGWALHLGNVRFRRFIT